MPPGPLAATRGPRPASRTASAAENHALVLSASAFLVCVMAGSVVFAGQRTPLMGLPSVGLTASPAAGCCGAIAFASTAIRNTLRTARTRDGRWRRSVDASILALTGGAIVMLLTLSLFAVFDLAFQGLRLDALPSSLLVAISAAAAAYALTLIAAEVTSLAITNLLMLSLLSGGLASMLSASDPGWWQRNFSALGAGGGFSGYAFNVTLILAGLVLAVLSGHLVEDLRTVARTPRRRLALLRGWFVAIGILLIGVGCVSVETNKVVHTLLASSMTLLFLALVVAIRFLAPGLPRSFLAASTVLVSCFGLAILLMWPARYFNLTAVELIGCVLLLAWLLVLVRTIAAQRRDLLSGG